jgi:hypothetical protein
MSKKPTYFELLKDPRWQRRRLERMQISNFSCDRYGVTELTLHIHHGAYLKGKDPWDYEDGMLHCLCESCHSWASEMQQNILTILSHAPPDHYPSIGILLSNFITQQDNVLKES